MRFQLSPFFAIKFYYHAKEFIIGDISDKNKPFHHYTQVILNLPGMKLFDHHRLPAWWVMKWDSDLNCIPAAIVTFLDDVRASRSTSEIVWQVDQQLAKYLLVQYLGIQNTPHKLRPPCQHEDLGLGWGNNRGK